MRIMAAYAAKYASPPVGWLENPRLLAPQGKGLFLSILARGGQRDRSSPSTLPVDEVGQRPRPAASGPYAMKRDVLEKDCEYALPIRRPPPQ